MITSLPLVTRIVSAVDESAKVQTLTLDTSIRADPGQFVMAWLPGIDERPFSLVDADPVILTVARVGRFSEAIHRLGAGERLWVRGPLGRPFTLPQSSPSLSQGEGWGEGGSGLTPKLLMVAGGYGVAPLHFLARRAIAAGWNVEVVIGARTADDVIFVARFQALGADVVITTDDGSLGQAGLATEATARLLDQAGYKAIYACGPEAMLEAVERLARARKMPAQLSYERAMRCAFGVCGTCSRQGWLVCRDGPVLKIEP
jgi:dihydroorotate dehydrogenase electron transfer subunit